MEKVLMASMVAVMVASAEVRAQHSARVFDGGDPPEGEEIDLTPAPKLPPVPLDEPAYMSITHDLHRKNQRSEALARMLRNKGRK